MTTPLRLVDDPDREVPGQLEFDPVDPRGQWPRMLVLDEDVKEQLVQWLSSELDAARTEKQPIIEDWKRWQEQYWAQPESEVKNFPFERAANVVIPLTAIAVEAVHARIMNTIFAVEPFWSIRPKTKEWLKVARPTEDFLQNEAENSNSLGVYTFCNDSLIELAKLGTCVGKSGYIREFKKTLRPTGTKRDEPFYVESRNGATLEYVPVANFLIRVSENDPQVSAWVGEEHTFSWGQLKKMVQAGQIDGDELEKIKFWINSQRVSTSGDSQDYQQRLDELQNTEPLWDDKFRVQEIWASFDVDEDGEDEEIVLDFHWESMSILSTRYNWYSDLHRPFRTTQYVKVEGRIYGIGIGKQNEQFQEAVTTIHRQRLDNATLANMRMMAARKGSGITPDEPIFPGKIFFVDDPQKDIQVVQLSEIYQSALINEESLLRYSERRTGVNEVLLGLPPQGTPGTATGDLARIAEGNKRFDLVLRNIREWLSELGQDVLSNYQQFGDQQRHWLVLGEKGEFVEQVLNIPQQLATIGVGVELTATSSITNRQVEQRMWLDLFGVLTNYYRQVIELAAMLQDPQILVPVAQRAVLAADEAMRRLLETFNTPDAERLLFLPEGEENAGGGDAGGVPSGPGPLIRRRVSELARQKGVGGVGRGDEGSQNVAGQGDLLSQLAGRGVL